MLWISVHIHLWRTILLAKFILGCQLICIWFAIYRFSFEPLVISNLAILPLFYSVTQRSILFPLNVMSRFTFEQHWDICWILGKKKHRRAVWTIFVQIKWLLVFPKPFYAADNKSVQKLSITSGFREKGFFLNRVFDHFWKIVKLSTDVLETSILSEIDNWSLLFKMSPKPNWLHAPLK